MKKIVYIILIFLVSGYAAAQERTDSHDNAQEHQDNYRMYLAQNVNDDENAPLQENAPAESEPPVEEQLPFPLPRISVSTEKPITAGLKAGGQAVPVTGITAPSQAGEETAVPGPGQEETGPVPVQTIRESAGVKIGQKMMEEFSIYNVPSGNLRTMKIISDEEYNLRGMVYGDELSYLHVLNADNSGNFREVWKSPSLNSPVRGVFVEDMQGDGDAEIIAYTADGDFFIYGYENHDLQYRTPDGMYENILCMQIANIDETPELEILFIAVKSGEQQSVEGRPVGNLIQFDPLSQFEEWTSQEKYSATDMVIGNVDTDDDLEIILNTGEILDTQFKDLKWRSNIAFGSRLYLIDMDDDGILEVVTEFDESYVRIIDVDQRREKW